MQYDLSVSTFSPDGRVFQTDYAQKAVDNSGSEGAGAEVPSVTTCLLHRLCMYGEAKELSLVPSGRRLALNAKTALSW